MALLNNLNEIKVLGRNSDTILQCSLFLQMRSIAAIQSKCHISQSEECRYLGLHVNVSGSNPHHIFHFILFHYRIV